EEASSTAKANWKVVGIGVPQVLLDPLERGLRESGFVPVLLPDYQTAESVLDTNPVDALVTYFEAPLDANRVAGVAEFVRRSGAVWLVLVNGSSLSDRLSIYEKSPDDLVQLPVTAGELVARLERLRAERGPASTRKASAAQTFSGSLRDMSLADLIRLLTVGAKTGIIVVRSENREGYVFVEAGDVVDAVLNGLSPEDALLRMLLWDEGEYELRFGPFERARRLAEESVNRTLEEYRRLRSILLDWGDALPHAERRLVGVEPEPGTELTSEETDLLVALDGKRSLLDLLTDGTLANDHWLEVFRGLLTKGLVAEVKQTERKAPERAQGAESRLLSALPSLLRTDASPGEGGGRPIRRMFRGRVANRPGLGQSELLQIRQDLLRQ
ncbi:MAG TPA: DUF4388 domain-containing protein, partial [Bacteroidetes bacterium]|nr:DUF4388 domain-containing protein [Bacteroidota bacterium]